MTATYGLADYVANIRSIYARSTREDYTEGTDWYPAAQGIARAIGAISGLGTAEVAAIISALSPRIWWADNIEAARKVCRASCAKGAEMPKTRAFRANTLKAWRIANGESWREVLKGRKVESFVANITGDLARVTVDTWALRVATLGAEDTLASGRKGDAQYRTVELAYQTVAAEVGLAPAALQAIVWVTAKRLCPRKGKGNTRKYRMAQLSAAD